MNGDEIQIDNGEFVRIHFGILEMLAKTRLNGQEFRALLFLFRKTYGWNKKEDAISLSQWCEGLGLTHRQHVVGILAGLIAKKIIYRNGKTGLIHIYGFNKYFEEWEAGATPQGNTLYEGVTPQGNRSVTSQGNGVLPHSVTEVLPHRVTTKDNKRQLTKDKLKTKKPRDENLDHPAVIAYRGICKLTPNEVQRKAIAETVTNLESWNETLSAWMLSGWKPTNIAGQLERYKTSNPKTKQQPKGEYRDGMFYPDGAQL
jgi:phage replication O-like protein O